MPRYPSLNLAPLCKQHGNPWATVPAGSAPPSLLPAVMSAITTVAACMATGVAIALAVILPAEAAEAAADQADTPALQTVPEVDLTRYMGHWYQIAFYPNEFQEKCVADVTADYKLLANGQVEVRNRCRQADGSINEAIGRARPQQGRFLNIPYGQPESTARLEVRFAPALLSWLPKVWAPYWVIQLADDYRYTVVSEPTREYLWILARTPTLSEQDESAIRARLTEQGFALDKLVKQPQTADPNVP